MPGIENRAQHAATGALWAFHVEEGCARTASELEHHHCLTAAHGWSWLHFPISDARARLFIERFDKLPEPARALLLGGETRPQIHSADGWRFGVLPDLERDFAGAASGAGRLYFAFDNRHFLTLRRHALQCVDDVRRALEQGEQAAEPAALFARLIERYFDRTEIRLLELTGELDTAEDKVLSGGADPARLKTGPIRRELSRMLREFIGLRAALTRAAKLGPAAHPAPTAWSSLIQDLDDVDHQIANASDRARLLHEEIGALIDSAANKSLRLLTILSTLMMPPTLIVGAFGMNLQGIPHADDPNAFAWACFLCLLVVVLAFIALRRSGALR